MLLCNKMKGRWRERLVTRDWLSTPQAHCTHQLCTVWTVLFFRVFANIWRGKNQLGLLHLLCLQGEKMCEVFLCLSKSISTFLLLFPKPWSHSMLGFSQRRANVSSCTTRLTVQPTYSSHAVHFLKRLPAQEPRNPSVYHHFVVIVQHTSSMWPKLKRMRLEAWRWGKKTIECWLNILPSFSADTLLQLSPRWEKPGTHHRH